MKTFLICPVRGVSESAWMKHVIDLEDQGYEVHYPPRDTDQEDDIGIQICRDNRQAIKESDCVHMIWDGKSQGCLFDLGMAFAMSKEVKPILLPEKTHGKSFQNMVSELYRQQRKYQGEWGVV